LLASIGYPGIAGNSHGIFAGGPRFNANTAPNFLNPEDYIDRRWQLADNFTFTTGTSYIAGA
jgi:hypothetical protein